MPSGATPSGTTTPVPEPIVALPNPANGSFPDNTTPPVIGREDAGVLSMGEQRLGRIAVANENDWYRVNLVSGRRYQFNDLRANLGVGDPKLRLYDPRGFLVHDPAVSDDLGGNFNSTLFYTALESGTYFLVAGGFNGGAHSYVVSYNQVV